MSRSTYSSSPSTFGGSFSTMQTGCLTGGVKRSSGVNILSDVSENWTKVRDDCSNDTDWMMCGFVKGSKTDITTLSMGGGGVEALSKSLMSDIPAFGGFRLRSTGRFVTFFHVGDHSTPALIKGRVCLYKQAVFNVFQGSDCEVSITPGFTTEHDVMNQLREKISSLKNSSSNASHLHKETTENSKRKVLPTKFHTNNSLPLNSKFQLETSSASDVTPDVSRRIEKMTDICQYPYETLRNITDSSLLPPGVDPAHRELSLNPQEFMHVFEIDSASFFKLPKWKQTQLKKKVQLF
jgi:hypothetical protein